jgi:hypothetical protein
VVDQTATGDGVVMNRFRAVAIGIEEEPTVVALGVLRARPRLSVAPVSGFRPDAPKLVDVVA